LPSLKKRRTGTKWQRPSYPVLRPANCEILNAMVGCQRRARFDQGVNTPRSPSLLLHDLFGLLVRRFRDLPFKVLEQSLHFFLALVALVLGQLSILLGRVEMLVAVAADVAACDLGVLGRFLDARHHLLPLLAAEGRHGEANHLAVVVRRHAEVARPDRL